MSILTDILGAGVNAASGGAIGAIASIGTGIVSIFTAKAQFAHEEAMAKHELERIAANSDAQSKLSADQLKIVVNQGADESFKAAQIAAGNMTNVWPIVASIVSLVRPAILAYLGIVSHIYYLNATPDEKTFIVQAMVELFSMGVGFYFGSRSIIKMVPSKSQSASE